MNHRFYCVLLSTLIFHTNPSLAHPPGGGLEDSREFQDLSISSRESAKQRFLSRQLVLLRKLNSSRGLTEGFQKLTDLIRVNSADSHQSRELVVDLQKQIQHILTVNFYQDRNMSMEERQRIIWVIGRLVTYAPSMHPSVVHNYIDFFKQIIKNENSSIILKVRAAEALAEVALAAGDTIMARHRNELRMLSHQFGAHPNSSDGYLAQHLDMAILLSFSREEIMKDKIGELVKQNGDANLQKRLLITLEVAARVMAKVYMATERVSVTARILKGIIRFVGLENEFSKYDVHFRVRDVSGNRDANFVVGEMYNNHEERESNARLVQGNSTVDINYIRDNIVLHDDSEVPQFVLHIYNSIHRNSGSGVNGNPRKDTVRLLMVQDPFEHQGRRYGTIEELNERTRRLRGPNQVNGTGRLGGGPRGR